MKYLLPLSLLLYPLYLHPAGMVPSVYHALDVASDKQNLPRSILRALCKIESNYNPKAVNQFDGGSASYGLLQIKARTAKSLGYRGPVRGLYDPYVNADLGAKYLSYQFRRYNGNWIKAISAYSRGNALAIHSEYVNKVFKEIVHQ